MTILPGEGALKFKQAIRDVESMLEPVALRPLLADWIR